MIRLPYGMADFRAIRRDDYVYLDRTSYLRHVEELGRALIFLRPRRFGKSLWLQTLHSYYDLRFEDDFESLFGGLAIGERPTELRHRFFVLGWDFSEIGPRGDVASISDRLNVYVNNKIRDLLTVYGDRIPGPVPIEPHCTDTFRHLLTAISRTPYGLYLLIDEYDNFVNEVMVEDQSTYRGLVQADGPFKELFKSVKSAMQGQGLERVFITGVSPVALNDLSSGFNIGEDVYLHAELSALCGFTEEEIRAELLAPIVAERGLDESEADRALRVMRTWYNGYRFSVDAEEPVYNPTNVLYFLKHFQRSGAAPVQLHDRNLATDQAKLAFLGRTPASRALISELAEGDGVLDILGLETQFSLEDLVDRLDVDRNFLASFLYFLGLLTQTRTPHRLKIPNLAVRKLYLERMLQTHLPDLEDQDAARRLALDFFADGRIEPLLGFVERKLLPALSNRDYRGMRELVLKSLLLALLFDDRRWTVFSELELERGYCDLCLLRRAEARESVDFDLLFELKYLPLGALSLSGEELRRLGPEEARKLPPVEEAFREAHEQTRRYGEALKRLRGGVELKAFAVVAVGFELLLGEASPAAS